MCIELRENNDPTVKKKLGWVAQRQKYFHFQRLSESQELSRKSEKENENESFDAAQPNKPQQQKIW